MPEIELHDVPLFSKMDQQTVAGIRAIMEEVKFTAGQVIIREGDAGDLFYIITEGRAQVLGRDGAGKDLILREIGPGGFFGELSMLTNEKRTARVVALGQVTTLALERDHFLKFLRSHADAAIDVMIELGSRLHQNDQVMRHMVSRNANEVEEESLTYGQRIADRATDIIGSWRFIITQSVLLVIWIILNVTAWMMHWDPYPFILLNLMLSFQSAYAGPVIMMSQNRQTSKDRIAAEIDHEVNAKAEMEVGLLMQQVDKLEQMVEENQAELKRLLAQK